MNRQSSQSRRHPVLVVLLVVLTMFALLGLSFRVILLPPVTTTIAQNTVNSSLSVVSHDQLVKVAEMGRAFVAGDKGAQLPVGSDPTRAYPPDVVSHMQDVQKVIHGAFIVTLALLGLLLLTLILAGIRGGARTVYTGLAFGGVMAVVMVAALAVVGFLSFDSLFTGLHKLLFTDGTWTFAEDSLLICAYPLPFWIGMGLAWGVAHLVLSLVVSVGGFMLRGRNRRRAQAAG